MEDFTIFDFSHAFTSAVESFVDEFRAFLEAREVEIPESPRSFGGNVYFSLSGHGVGFWDSSETEHLQPLLEEFAGGKYRFEEIDLSEDESGKLDLSVMSEFITESRNRIFATPKGYAIKTPEGYLTNQGKDTWLESTPVEWALYSSASHAQQYCPKSGEVVPVYPSARQ